MRSLPFKIKLKTYSPVILLLITFFKTGLSYAEWNLDHTGAYFTSFFQSHGANSNSGLLMWSPTFNSDLPYSLVSDFGLTYLNNAENKRFIAIQISERLSYKLNPKMSLELSAGLANWTSQSGSAPLYGCSTIFHYDPDSFLHPKFMDWRLGVQQIAKSDYPTLQFLVGLEFAFGEPKPNVETNSSPPANAATSSPPPEPIPQISNTPQPIQSTVDNTFHSGDSIKTSSDGLRLSLSADHLNFKTGKANLGSAAKRYLEGIVAIFKKYQSSWQKLTITGHTDNLGNAERNLSLSKKRAQAVAEIFTKEKDIDSSLIEIRGAGPHEPLEDNKSKTGRQKNRRVEIFVSSPPDALSDLSNELMMFYKSLEKEKN